MLEPKVKLNRLEKSICAFEEETIKEGLILFYGDSAFTRWSGKYGMPSLTDEIRKKDGSIAVVNHGFGGSTAEEQLYYYQRAVKPWKPKALVLLTFGNDHDCNYTPEEILALQSRIVEYAKIDFPEIRIFICSHRPYPLFDAPVLGMGPRSAVKQYNELLSLYCSLHPEITLVDVYNDPRFYTSPENTGNLKEVREELYIEDRVHFNEKGYAIFKEIFMNALSDLL